MKRHHPRDPKAEAASDALDRIEAVLAQAAEVRDYIATLQRKDRDDDQR